MALPAPLRRIPLAHRGYHHGPNCPENSRAAFRAAVDAGYGIEMDAQLSSDGQAMVFHDYDLGRLTHDSGPIRQRSAAELSKIILKGTQEGIPRLSEVLELVDWRVPLLIEIKDQDGIMGPDVGILEQAVARDLKHYEGPVAVMSFNPHAVAAFGDAAPDIARGLVTSAFSDQAWPLLSQATREHLREIPDFDVVGASFISHQASDLSNARVRELKRKGVPILCWTIHDPGEEIRARRIADNITFEGYAPKIPSP